MEYALPLQSRIVAKFKQNSTHVVTIQTAESELRRAPCDAPRQTDESELVTVMRTRERAALSR